MAWRVEGENQPEIMDGRDVICDFRGSTFAPVIDFEHARVMAAAPELLAACEDIVEVAEALLDVVPYESRGRIIPGYNVARAAIAKARGN